MALPDIKETHTYFTTELKSRFPDLAYLHAVESRIAGNVTVDADESETLDFLVSFLFAFPRLLLLLELSFTLLPSFAERSLVAQAFLRRWRIQGGLGGGRGCSTWRRQRRSRLWPLLHLQRASGPSPLRLLRFEQKLTLLPPGFLSRSLTSSSGSATASPSHPTTATPSTCSDLTNPKV